MLPDHLFSLLAPVCLAHLPTHLFIVALPPLPPLLPPFTLAEAKGKLRLTMSFSSVTLHGVVFSFFLFFLFLFTVASPAPTHLI